MWPHGSCFLIPRKHSSFWPRREREREMGLSVGLGLQPHSPPDLQIELVSLGHLVLTSGLETVVPELEGRRSLGPGKGAAQSALETITLSQNWELWVSTRTLHVMYIKVGGLLTCPSYLSSGNLEAKKGEVKAGPWVHLGEEPWVGKKGSPEKYSLPAVLSTPQAVTYHTVTIGNSTVFIFESV